MRLRRFSYRPPAIVQPNYGRRAISLVVLLIILLLSTGWFAFEYGRLRSGFDSAQAERRQLDLAAEMEKLTDERKRLKQQVANLQRASQIDREAARGLQEKLKQLQEKMLATRESLAFYKGIVEGGEAVPALRVHEFKLENLPEPRQYQASFTVSQLLKNYGQSKGEIELSVTGVQGGEVRSLSLEQLTDGKQKAIKMGFKHFQEVVVAIQLPEEFLPDAIEVVVRPIDKKLASVTKRYDWNPGS